MNNTFKYFFFLILLSNCSLDTKSGIWTDKKELILAELESDTSQVFDNKKPLSKEFNADLKSILERHQPERTQIHTHIHSCKHTYIHTYIHTRKHTHRRTDTYKHTPIHTWTHAQTYTDTYTRIHIHTDTHIRTCLHKKHTHTKT